VKARFVYISTDYVFDGEKGDYREEDAPGPVNRYGESKLLGEEWVRRCCSGALILRTTMFGLKIPPTKGLMETLVEALRSGRPLFRFTDQYFTPLYTGYFSELILRFVSLGARGLFHVGAKAKISRCEFSRQVAQIFAADRADIRPVAFRQMEGLARRPKNTSLTSEVIEGRLGIKLPTVGAGLEQLKAEWNSIEKGTKIRC
jgi:dTDP-4-dehydrorhamnose reductase